MTINITDCLEYLCFLLTIADTHLFMKNSCSAAVHWCNRCFGCKGAKPVCMKYFSLKGRRWNNAWLLWANPVTLGCMTIFFTPPFSQKKLDLIEFHLLEKYRNRFSFLLQLANARSFFRFWTVLEASLFLFLPARLIKGMIVELFFLCLFTKS